MPIHADGCQHRARVANEARRKTAAASPSQADQLHDTTSASRRCCGVHVRLWRWCEGGSPCIERAPRPSPQAVLFLEVYDRCLGGGLQARGMSVYASHVAIRLFAWFEIHAGLRQRAGAAGQRQKPQTNS